MAFGKLLFGSCCSSKTSLGFTEYRYFLKLTLNENSLKIGLKIDFSELVIFGKVQAQKNLQPKHHQDQLQLYEQHETNNR